MKALSSTFIAPTTRELIKAFKEFRSHAGDALKSKQCCLDFFYAVECGLKAILIQQKFNDRLPENFKTHDINKLIDNIDNFVCMRINDRCNLPHNKSYNSKNLHIILRYGIKISDVEWKKFAESLNTIYDTIAKRIRRDRLI